MTNKPRLSPALSYLALVRSRIAAVRKDIPHLTELGEEIAGHLLAGGEICPPGISPFWPSEFCGRAGGLMGIRKYGYPEWRRHDVAFFPTPDPRRWDPAQDERWSALSKTRANLYLIGPESDVAAVGNTRRFSGFTGGVSPDEGLYATAGFRPLAPLRPLEMLLRGWCATGELIAACTRAGKMPVIWMSVWLEGSLARNASMIRHDNLSEPWDVPLFHEDRYVPPLDPGYAATEFLDIVEDIVGVLESQAAKLALAGRWIAEAKKEGRRAHTIAVGHSYPAILEIPEGADYPLTWGRSNSNLRTAVPKSLKAGDLMLHQGYAPVSVPLVERILKRGIRFIHTSPYGRPANLEDRENFLWYDLPWRPADASVDVPGYGVRILPTSSSAHTAAFFSILCEAAERMGWKD